MPFARYAEDIVNTLREPLLLLNADLTIRLANDAFYRAFAQKPASTEGSSVLDLLGGDTAALRNALRTVLADHASFERLEIACAQADHATRTFWLNGRELSTAGPDDRLILIAMEDVTERCETERALARQARDLGALNAALRRSNEALEQFAHVASHDLKEPLRKVQAYGDLLQQECGATLGEQGNDYLRRILAAGLWLRGLVEDVLSLARVTTQPQVPILVDMDRLVHQIVGDLEISLREAGATVEVASLPTLQADAAQLRQLFRNLLGNALKFRTPGVPPRIQVASRRLRPSDFGSDALDWEVTVSDNGIGLDEQYSRVIFEPFRRLHRRGEYEGTGIGLAICKRVVERHHGTITVRSGPGQGATFVITLPERQPTEGVLS